MGNFDPIIAAAAYKAGFRGKNLRIAVAVALAESGGNFKAHNDKPPDNSYGLWQINMIGAMGPARRRQFGIGNNEDLFDPQTNAKAAWAISSQGRNWRPWTTYTSGAYRNHLGAADSAAKAVENSPDKGEAWWQKSGLELIGIDTPEIPNPLKGIEAVADALQGVGRFFTTLLSGRFWVRVGMIIGGVILILIALSILIFDKAPSPMRKGLKTAMRKGKK